FFSSRRRHTRWPRDWSSDVCSSDLTVNLVFDPALEVLGLTPDELRAQLLIFLSHHCVSSRKAIQRTGRAISSRHRGRSWIEGRRSEERRVGKEWRSGGGRGW